LPPGREGENGTEAQEGGMPEISHDNKVQQNYLMRNVCHRRKPATMITAKMFSHKLFG